MSRPPSQPTAPTRGRIAEDRALEFLQQQGLRLIERNYRCRFGEIDLIMEDGPTLALVEVRFRSNPRFGGALESVDWRKQAKLKTTATCFLKERSLFDRPARFDVAALSPTASGMAVEWIKDAFRAG
ncbi:YraN family protein [Methylomagnum sp.]